MRFLFSTILFFAISAVGSAQQPISHLQIPLPQHLASQPGDPELQNLIWNKWDVNGFTILSLDPNQGKYLHDNILPMKKWVLTRWGLPDAGLTAECRVVCVPTQRLMKKLFRLDESYGEVRRDESGRAKMTVLWLVLDRSPAEVLPSALTTICSEEVFRGHFWARRGMSVLNSTLPQIRQKLGALQMPMQQNQEMFFADHLFGLKEEDYVSLEPALQQLYDQQAASLVLLFRKEFGQRSLLSFLQTSGSAADLNSVFGFTNYQQFDATLKRYMLHLSSDVVQGRTPNSYLLISTPK